MTGQKVQMTRNGPEFTVLLSLAELSNYDYARVDLPMDKAERLYGKIVRAMIERRGTWEERKQLVEAAG